MGPINNYWLSFQKTYLALNDSIVINPFMTHASILKEWKRVPTFHERAPIHHLGKIKFIILSIVSVRSSSKNSAWLNQQILSSELRENGILQYYCLFPDMLNDNGVKQWKKKFFNSLISWLLIPIFPVTLQHGNNSLIMMHTLIAQTSTKWMNISMN